MVYSKFCFIVKFFKHLLKIHKRDPGVVSRDKTYNVHTVMSDSLGSHGLGHARLLCPWNFPGKNTGVGYSRISFSRGSFRPRDGTCVSCIAGGFFKPLHHLGSPVIYILLSYYAIILFHLLWFWQLRISQKLSLKKDRVLKTH